MVLLCAASLGVSDAPRPRGQLVAHPQVRSSEPPARLTPGGKTLSVRTAVDVGFSPGFQVLQESTNELHRDLSGIRTLGARRLRVDISWAAVQPSEGEFQWTATDRVLEAARKAGLRVLAVLCYEPSWARTGDPGHAHPVDPTLFAEFAAAAATRYRRLVDAWEVWNEPNTRRFWPSGPDPAAYAQLVEAAAPRLHAADPGSVVVAGALAPATAAADGSEIPPETFLRDVYDRTDPELFDAVSVHPYSYPALPTGNQPWNLFARLADLRAVMVAAGDGDARLWITEYGAPTGRSKASVSQRRQARMLVTAYRVWRRLDHAGPLFFYSYRDRGRRLADVEDNFGVLRYGRRPKLALSALQRLLEHPTQPVERR